MVFRSYFVKKYHSVQHLSLRVVGTYLVPFVTVPSAPLNFSLAPISGSPDMLLAMWTAPAKQNSSITAYTVYCNTSATQAYIEPLVVNGTTLTTIIDHDLGPYSQYDCYVTANTSSGEGMASRVLSARTSELSEPICSVTHYSLVKSTCIEIIYITMLLSISFSNYSPICSTECFIGSCFWLTQQTIDQLDSPSQ